MKIAALTQQQADVLRSCATGNCWDCSPPCFTGWLTEKQWRRFMAAANEAKRERRRADSNTSGGAA